MPTKTEERTIKVKELTHDLVRPYRNLFNQLDRETQEELVHPDAVLQYVRERVAKSGTVRFTKKLPSKYLEPSGDPNPAYLFHLHSRHTGTGIYLNIGPLVEANMMFGREMYERFDRTVDLMYRLQNGISYGGLV